MYITVDVGMPENRKIIGLSDRAFRQMVELWCYCGRTLADGRVPAAMWAKSTTPATRRELTAVLDGEAFPLAVELPVGDVQLHDYLEHQRSKAEVEVLREKRREAGAKGGRAKANRQASATANGKQTPSKSVADTETDTETEPNGSDEPPEYFDPPPRSDVEQLCDILAERIEANGSKRPTVTKAWRDAARLMLDRDGRTSAEVVKMIDWCQADEFWRGNILSMPKLREKFDQLRLQASRAPAGGRSTTDDRVAQVQALKTPTGGLS